MTTIPDRLGLSALPIRTARLSLRRLRAADAEAVQKLLGARAVAAPTLRIPHPYPAGGAAQWIADSESAIAAGTDLTLALARAEDDAPVGAVHLALRAGSEAELGYWLGRPFWGRGLMSEAVAALAAHGFARIGLRAIEASTLADNLGSIRVLEKAGFAVARTERREAPARGGPVDMIVRRLEGAAWRAANPVPMLLVVAVALVDGDGRVLIAERPAGKPMAGLWEFPGGKLAEGETPERALVRELAEELGIDTAESCLAPIAFASHRYEKFHLLMPLYVCRVWQGTPEPREGQRLKWVRPMKLRDYPMPPADIPLIAQLRELL